MEILCLTSQYFKIRVHFAAFFGGRSWPKKSGGVSIDSSTESPAFVGVEFEFDDDM